MVFIRSPQVCAPLWPQKSTELWNPGWAMASPRRPHLTLLTSNPDWSYCPGSLLPSPVQQPLVVFYVLEILRKGTELSPAVNWWWSNSYPSPSLVWAGNAQRYTLWVKARSEGCTCLRHMRPLLRLTLTIEPGLGFQEHQFSNTRKQREVI